MIVNGTTQKVLLLFFYKQLFRSSVPKHWDQSRPKVGFYFSVVMPSQKKEIQKESYTFDLDILKSDGETYVRIRKAWEKMSKLLLMFSKIL